MVTRYTGFMLDQEQEKGAVVRYTITDPEGNEWVGAIDPEDWERLTQRADREQLDVETVMRGMVRLSAVFAGGGR